MLIGLISREIELHRFNLQITCRMHSYFCFFVFFPSSFYRSAKVTIRPLCDTYRCHANRPPRNPLPHPPPSRTDLFSLHTYRNCEEKNGSLFMSIGCGKKEHTFTGEDDINYLLCITLIKIIYVFIFHQTNKLLVILRKIKTKLSTFKQMTTGDSWYVARKVVYN